VEQLPKPILPGRFTPKISPMENKDTPYWICTKTVRQAYPILGIRTVWRNFFFPDKFRSQPKILIGTINFPMNSQQKLLRPFIRPIKPKKAEFTTGFSDVNTVII